MSTAYDRIHKTELAAAQENSRKTDAAAHVVNGIAIGTGAVLAGFALGAGALGTAGLGSTAIGSAGFGSAGVGTGLVAAGTAVAPTVSSYVEELEAEADEGLGELSDAIETWGSEARVKVIAKLEINGQKFWGMNGKCGLPQFNKLNFHWGHAEIDVLARAANTVPTIGQRAIIWVSESCCSACLSLDPLGGNITKAFNQMGLSSLTIHSPFQSLVIEGGRIVSWITR